VLRLAANLSFLFTESPFLDRFARAAAHGFAGVEYLFPYEWPAAELRARLDAHGLEQVLFNASPGDWEAGERGLAARPDRVGEFRASIETAAGYAVALGCARVHVMAGTGGNDDCYVNNIGWAVERLGRDGVQVTIEPLNRRDFPGYHLCSVEQARRVCQATGSRLQYDVYHVQILQGDLTTRLRSSFDVLGHVQVAGVPQRHEPDTGEVRTEELLAVLDELGYDGWVGCEYRPAADTASGLAWAAVHGVSPAPRH
jgi:hydroxypyruvate isomerase